MGCGCGCPEDARMSKFVYTQEMINYVREIATGRYNDEIAEMFNNKFNLKKSVNAINSMKRKNEIKSGKLPKKERYAAKLFTKEQSKFLIDNVKGISNKKLRELMNEKFDLSLSERQIQNYKNNNNLSSGLTGHFEKGKKPWNAGMKGLNTGGEKGWFKKGRPSHNSAPVGTEVIVDEGYKETKIAEPNVWKRNHVIMWEEENGEVPENHVIIFLDQNKSNVTIGNLAMLHRRELSMMNYHKLFSNDAEVTLSGIALVRLKDRLNEAERMGNDREKYNEYKKTAKKNGISESTFVARIKRGWSLHDSTYKPLHTNFKSEVLT